MHLIRRAAFRAAASPATSFASKSRSINTSSSFLLRSRIQSNISPSVFRRFASDDANAQEQSIESADGEERGSVRSAIDSVTESASTYASDAAESISEHVNEVKESVYDGAQAAAAATGVAPNRERRPYNGDREERRPYNREGRGRSGYQEARRAAGGYDRGGDREAPDRVVRPTTGIYVGNLLFDVTAADLEKEFEPFGKIKSTVVAADARGLSKGFGYVEFETIDQAAAAIEAKNQTVLEGRRLIVNYMTRTVREPRENTPSKTLFIGNLAFEMSDSDLNKLFRDIRNVIDVRVAIDRRTGQPRGFAHADFVDVDSATKGKEALTGKEVYGRKLRIDFSAANQDSGRRREGGGGGDRESSERRASF